MVKTRKSAEPEQSVLRNAKELTALRAILALGRPPKPRTPPENYKYIDELAHLQFELIKLQEWVCLLGLQVVVIFEGRDAAGKSDVINRITESLNPRICRVVAVGTPTERERGQCYFHQPSCQRAGEIVLFDRSWYNRAGVEHVMGFCSAEEHREFLRSCPLFEEMLVRAGIHLIKYWFSVNDEEQERRFKEGSTIRSSAGSLARWIFELRKTLHKLLRLRSPWFRGRGRDGNVRELPKSDAKSRTNAAPELTPSCMSGAGRSIPGNEQRRWRRSPAQ